MRSTFLVIYGVALIVISVVSDGEDVYKAAVVEYSSDLKTDLLPAQILVNNVESYSRYIDKAGKQNVDIIVFPQYGLTSRDAVEGRSVEELRNFSIPVPEADDHVVPCDTPTDYHRVLSNLSCAAKRNQMYVVTHLVERKGDHDLFNTLIVFDREGTIICKYRGINSVESNIRTGYELQRFSTDFDVTFALLLGNDLLHRTAVWDTFDSRNISNVILSMAWKSESPFLTALSVQAGYARATGVNLLAAGLNDPGNKHGGTGIYYANGRIAELYISPSKSSKLLVQTVPKVAVRWPATKCQNNSNEMPRFRLGGSLNVGTFSTDTENMENYTFADLARFSPKTVRRVCSAEDTYCCDFNVTVSTKDDNYEDEPIYKLVAFHGIRDFGDSTIGVRTCGIISCENNNIRTCGKINTVKRSRIKFEAIEIRARFMRSRHTHDQPTTATYDLIPLTGYTYCEELIDSNRKVYIEMLTTQPVENLLVFGILGRVYNHDGRGSGIAVIEATAAGISRNVILIIILTSLILLIALVLIYKCIRRSCEYQFQAVPTK